MNPGIKGVIFDLDDTLFDCTGQLTGPARWRAARTLALARETLDPNALYEAQVDLAATGSSTSAIRTLGQRHNLPEPVIHRALAAYNTSTVETITPFPDTIPTLVELTRREYRLCLVTSGHPDRQRSKIDLLNLSDFFSEQRRTLVLHDDRQTSDKTPFLAQAVEWLSLSPQTLFSIGDKLDAEIAASKHLGMTTVRLRHGRQKDRIPQTPEEHPDFEIDTLSELLTLLP